MLTATSLLASWDQRDAEERERLVTNQRALDLLCEINECLVANGPESIRNMPLKVLEIVHSAAIERLSMLTLSVLNRKGE